MDHTHNSGLGFRHAGGGDGGTTPGVSHTRNRCTRVPGVGGGAGSPRRRAGKVSGPLLKRKIGRVVRPLEPAAREALPETPRPRATAQTEVAAGTRRGRGFWGLHGPGPSALRHGHAGRPRGETGTRGRERANERRESEEASRGSRWLVIDSSGFPVCYVNV